MSGEARVNFSTKRKHAEAAEKVTEAEFIRKRRNTVNGELCEFAANNPTTRANVLSDAVVKSSDQWCAEQQAAETKFKVRQRRGMAEAAVGDNVLIPSELSEQVVADAAAVKKTRAAADRQHNNKARKIQKRLQPRHRIEALHGMPVCFSSKLSHNHAVECQSRVRSLDLIHGNLDRHHCLLFVTDTVAMPGFHTLAAAQLCGGAIVNPEFFLSSGEKGLRITYHAATLTKRAIHITPAVRAAQKSLIAVIDACIRSAESKWKIISAVALAEYHDEDARRPQRNRRPMECLCLCTSGEKTSVVFQDAKWCFDIPSFFIPFPRAH